MEKIKIYTDGSCIDLQAGGWAFVAILPDGTQITNCGGEEVTTNNRMELGAILEALRYFETPSEIQIVSDSTYCVNTINKWIHLWKKLNWSKKKGELKNTDLIMEIYDLMQYHKVTAQWVKGHNGNHYNELADKLATESCLNYVPAYNL